jgi:hypothetical protein
MLTTAHALLSEEPEAENERIREVLSAVCVKTRDRGRHTMIRVAQKIFVCGKARVEAATASFK